MTSPYEKARQGGFTLIEMIIVVTIIGLSMGLVMSRRPMQSRGLDLRAAAKDLAGELREAQSAAIAENRTVRFEIDLTAKIFRTAAGLPHSLPAGIGLSVLSAAGQTGALHDAVLLFDPDGSSSGGRIELIDGRHKIQIGVDWLTGRVSIADAP